jgi:hypothetical protein
MDNQKRINGAVIYFAALIIIYEIVSLLASVTDIFSGITVEEDVILSQSLILIPTIVYFLITKQNPVDLLRFRKLHWASFLILPFLVICIEPIIVVVNAFSMMFVDNYISGVSDILLEENSLGMSLFYMALLPCIIEEMAYRGVLLGNFRHVNRLEAVIVSGCLFGIMHMNLNQMAYAVVMGIIFGFVVEATGSIFSTMIMHFCINGISVVLGYLVKLFPSMSSGTDSLTTDRSGYLMVIKAYLPFSIVGGCIAVALIVALSILHGRKEKFFAMFSRKEVEHQEKRAHIITPLLVVTIIYCIGKCIYDEFIAK